MIWHIETASGWVISCFFPEADMSLDPVLQQILDQTPEFETDVLDIPALRKMADESFSAMIGPGGLVPVASVEDRELAGPGGTMRIRIYRPEGEIVGTMLHFYGGAYMLGSIDQIDAVARRFARDLSMVVVTSSYRLAPEEPFPAVHDDVLFAARWVLDNVGELGGANLPVVLSGESAGGNLVAVTTQALRSQPGSKAVAGQLLINPSLDLRARAADYPSRRADANPLMDGKFLEQSYRNYAGSHDRADPRISPITAEDMTGLPPAVIAVLTVDALHDEAILCPAPSRGGGVCGRDRIQQPHARLLHDDRHRAGSRQGGRRDAGTPEEATPVFLTVRTRKSLDRRRPHRSMSFQDHQQTNR